VAEDVGGDRIGPVVRNGSVARGMPSFTLPDRDLQAIVAFVHDRATDAASQLGGRRSVDVSDLQTGDAEAGRRYFFGSGGCAKCHSPGGDLAGIATRLEGLALLQRMLYPPSERSGGATKPPTVRVTLPSGETVTGAQAYRDEFVIALTDQSGWYRSWPTRQVQVVVDDPLDAHIEQLGKYTDADMHDTLAFLQTLR
jgi:cytochrome c oxidase cbb3-type subunit 3